MRQPPLASCVMQSVYLFFDSVVLLKWWSFVSIFKPDLSIFKIWKEKILSTLSYCRQLWWFLWIFGFKILVSWRIVLRTRNFSQNIFIVKFLFSKWQNFATNESLWLAQLEYRSVNVGQILSTFKERKVEFFKESC